MKRLGLIIGLCLAVFSHAQDIFGDDKKTYVLMPADVISSGVVDRVDISESGRFVVYQRSSMPSLEDLASGKAKPVGTWYSYDRITKANTKLTVPESAREIRILGDGAFAFFFGNEPDGPQGFINLKSGAITQTQIPVQNITYMGAETFAPYLITQVENQPAQLIWGNGNKATIQMPQGYMLSLPTGSDDKNFYFLSYKRSKPMQFAKVTYRFVDENVNIKPCTREEWQAAYPGLRTKQLATWELLGDMIYVKLAELPKDVKSELPLRAKLGLNTCRPLLGGNGTFVVYQDGGALLVRDIKEVDTNLAKQMNLAALKAKAISEAKQSALALILYASDMDDVLPGAEGWEDKVNPYALNRDMLKNFNYTFRGGNLGSVTDPATTELGFTMGPGGRAVAYIDGHVRWIPNP